MGMIKDWLARQRKNGDRAEIPKATGVDHSMSQAAPAEKVAFTVYFEQGYSRGMLLPKRDPEHQLMDAKTTHADRGDDGGQGKKSR